MLGRIRQKMSFRSIAVFVIIILLILGSKFGIWTFVRFLQNKRPFCTEENEICESDGDCCSGRYLKCLDTGTTSTDGPIKRCNIAPLPIGTNVGSLSLIGNFSNLFVDQSELIDFESSIREIISGVYGIDSDRIIIMSTKEDTSQVLVENMDNQPSPSPSPSPSPLNSSHKIKMRIAVIPGEEGDVSEIDFESLRGLAFDEYNVLSSNQEYIVEENNVEENL